MHPERSLAMWGGLLEEMAQVRLLERDLALQERRHTPERPQGPAVRAHLARLLVRTGVRLDPSVAAAFPALAGPPTRQG
jgi:hypothetical protein